MYYHPGCGHHGHHGGHGHQGVACHEHHGGQHDESCCCSRGHHGRHFLTKEEQVRMLEQYLEELKAEAKGVEEHIAEIKKEQQ